MTSAVYETSAPGGNVLPRQSHVALALQGPKPLGEADNAIHGSGNGIDDSRAKKTPHRDRPIEPKPDASWHTPNREAWATIDGWHYPVLSREFRHWLAGRFYECNGEPASSYKLDELIAAYSAEALFRAPEHRVHLRPAQQGDAIWLDLADPEGRAVRIDKDGWRVVRGKEVTPKFFRPPNMKPLREKRPTRSNSGVY